MELRNLFFYCGPNRRSDLTAIELVLQWNESDAATVASQWQEAMPRLQTLAAAAGLDPEALPREPGADAGTTMAALSRLVCETAIALQRRSGHQVRWHQVLPDRVDGITLAIFEHEETSVGERAGIAALLCLREAFEG
ncbi:MAG: hypothetical protein R3348_05145, partial [Xanthomonadales bacterium]|nr:hypothetical protein [Xanthomonadales bacterium]